VLVPQRKIKQRLHLEQERRRTFVDGNRCRISRRGSTRAEETVRLSREQLFELVCQKPLSRRVGPVGPRDGYKLIRAAWESLIAYLSAQQRARRAAGEMQR
jgi:hypothetical protein